MMYINPIGLLTYLIIIAILFSIIYFAVYFAVKHALIDGKREKKE